MTIPLYDNLTPAVLDRFYSNIMPEPMSGCHLWLGTTNPNGYGKISIGGTMIKAHRIALALKLDRDVVGFALHSCDNPACVNPDHLREGTQQENVRDMMERGRGVAPGSRGNLNGRAKLTESQVYEIRALAGTMTQEAIGRLYGISQRQVSRIINRKKWAHVP